MDVTTLKRWMGTLALALVVVGCGGADEPAHVTTVDTDYVGTGPGDSGAWQAKTDGLTMWIDTTLQPDLRKDGTAWVLRGRVSKTITNVRAYDAVGRSFHTEQPSPRKFEVWLTEGQVLDVAAGERVYLDFFAEQGAVPLYHGMVRFGARFGAWEGSSSIFVYRAVNPVVVGSDVVFRGRASVKGGFALDYVYTDDDANPALIESVTEPRNYVFDWTPAQLHLAADRPGDRVHFRGSDVAGTPVEKSAALELRLVQMGVATVPPFDAWPRQTCQSVVLECLKSLDTPDTETCGFANEVRSCRGKYEPVTGPSAEHFVDDLRDALRTWYTSHEADVRAHGGRTLESALDAVTVERTGRVPADEVEAFGYEPAKTTVFFHPDPVFPGSDRVWYGVYDANGRLVAVETVN